MPEEIVSRILRLPGYRRMLCDQHEALRRARRTSHRLTDALRVIREQSQKAATQTYSIGENACGGRGGGSPGQRAPAIAQRPRWPCGGGPKSHGRAAGPVKV
jgi:hypothetical protein